VDQLFAGVLDVDAALVEIQKHRNLLADRGSHAACSVFDRFLVSSREELVWALEQSIRTLLANGGDVADVFPFVDDRPQSIPGHLGVNSELRFGYTVTAAVQDFIGKGDGGPLLDFGAGIPRQLRLQFGIERVLLIQTRTTERVYASRIRFGVAGDGGGRQLRCGLHDGPVLQYCSEGLERVFTEPEDSPGSTSKHVRFLLCV